MSIRDSGLKMRTALAPVGPTAPVARQWATVLSVISGSVLAVGITLGASAAPVLVVRYEASYSPTVGDTVVVDVDDNGVLFVIGKPK